MAIATTTPTPCDLVEKRSNDMWQSIQDLLDHNHRKRSDDFAIKPEKYNTDIIQNNDIDIWQNILQFFFIRPCSK